MKPSFVLQSLGLLMMITTTTYFFFIPPALLGNTNIKNLHGYWGKPNGEFDWCEANYLWTPYIAEPWNTVTGLSYIGVVAVAFPYYYQMQKRYNLRMGAVFNFMFLLIPLAIATFLFHATLQYKHQLLDEISMYLIICYGFAMVYSRCDPTSWYCLISLGYSSSFGVLMWITRSDRDGMFHQSCRGIMTITFGISFVYIFYCGAWMSKKCGKQCERLFDQCYGIWITSILCWLMDNLFCDALQRELTRYYIPYINYHGTVWHLGSCLGIHYMFHVMLVYGLVEHERVQIEVVQLWSIFPYVTVTAPKKRQ